MDLFKSLGGASDLSTCFYYKITLPRSLLAFSLPRDLGVRQLVPAVDEPSNRVHLLLALDDTVPGWLDL